MNAGSTPATAIECTFANGVIPRSLALSADIKTTAEAPSLSGLELPAVTVPPLIKAGSRLASLSSDVSRRGPSSTSITRPSGNGILGFTTNLILADQIFGGHAHWNIAGVGILQFAGREWRTCLFITICFN